MLTPADMPTGYQLDLSTADQVEVVDEQNRSLGVGGVLNETGVLSFKIQAKDTLTSERSIVRGKVLFELLMRHFGDRVNEVQTYWVVSSDNLETFNILTALGSTPADAARRTWSGQQLAGYGFGKVTFKETIGRAGLYALVSANFTR